LIIVFFFGFSYKMKYQDTNPREDEENYQRAVGELRLSIGIREE
jgi:hypothetical protein